MSVGSLVVGSVVCQGKAETPPTIDATNLGLSLQKRAEYVCRLLKQQTGRGEFLAQLQAKLPHLWPTNKNADGTLPVHNIPSFDGTIASLIDHTVLKPDASLQSIKTLCREATENKFPAVCVNPGRTKDAVDTLADLKSNVSVAAVCGFPLGANTTKVKIYETQNLIDLGASEIDMVINVGALIDGQYDLVLDDIDGVVKAAKAKKQNVVVKVIFETCLLTEAQIVDACLLSVLANAPFVKTSTGFSSSGAKVSDVRLMKLVVGDAAQVKASGGVRDYPTAKAMADNGARRIGASASLSIVSGDTSPHAATGRQRMY